MFLLGQCAVDLVTIVKTTILGVKARTVTGKILKVEVAFGTVLYSDATKHTDTGLMTAQMPLGNVALV